MDETTFLAARPTHRRLYATSLVDLDAKVIIDLVEGNGAADLQRWLRRADPGWLGGIGVVATDLAESFRAGLSPQLDDATRVADPFHVVRVANRCVDAVRRRVQNDTLGHRGRRGDPLYRIRKLLLTGDERLGDRGRHRLMAGLRFGDPHDETLGAWLAKEAVRSVYRTEDPDTAAVLLDTAITGCRTDDVAEIRSLGATLKRWRPEILAHHRTGASNGPTDGAEPGGQADQALRPWVQVVPAAGAAARRWSAMAIEAASTSHLSAVTEFPGRSVTEFPRPASRSV